METIYSGIVVTKLLQHELLVKSVNTIANGIVSTVSHITQNEHQINECFKKLDLHAELDTITSFVNEIAENEKFKNNSLPSEENSKSKSFLERFIFFFFEGRSTFSTS